MRDVLSSPYSKGFLYDFSFFVSVKFYPEMFINCCRGLGRTREEILVIFESLDFDIVSNVWMYRVRYYVYNLKDTGIGRRCRSLNRLLNL